MSSQNAPSDSPRELIAAFLILSAESRDAFVLLLIEYIQEVGTKKGRPDFAGMARTLLPIKSTAAGPPPHAPADELIQRIKQLPADLRYEFVLDICTHLRKAAQANGRTDFLAAARNILFFHVYHPAPESPEQEVIRINIMKDLSDPQRALFADRLLDPNDVAQRVGLLANHSSPSDQE